MTQISPRNADNDSYGLKFLLCYHKRTLDFLVLSGVVWTVMALMFMSPFNERSHQFQMLPSSTSPNLGGSLGDSGSFLSPVVAKEENNESMYIRSSDMPFDWDELEVAQNVTGKCGADKCFWLSTSDPKSVGYLVSSAQWHYSTMKKAYEFAVNVLEEKCHARHLLLAPPKRVKVSSDFVRKLESLKHNDHIKFRNKQGEKVTKLKEKRRVFDESDHTVVVQKVRVAPKPNLMFGFMAGKWDKLVEKDIPRFRSELQAAEISLQHIEEKLESERKGIECAMKYSQTYFYDLQGLIDLEGNYFHIDVDSQFWMGIEGQETEIDVTKTVTRATAYKRRHAMIGKFNGMIQRLVDPPPEGVSELSAW